MRKYEIISDLVDVTAGYVVQNEEEWRKYLNTASNLYKYSFKDQLLIYAQRPDATACASIEIWKCGALSGFYGSIGEGFPCPNPI